MKFTNTTQADTEQLTEWIQADPYHKDCLNPQWWFTGNGLLSYCLQDSKGPTMYVRLDKDEELLRLHTQFAPDNQVSKLRVVKSLMYALPRMEQFAKSKDLKGYVYRSTSQSLIDFMQIKFGFTPVGANDDYWLPFERET
jgi:hypothetical protein